MSEWPRPCPIPGHPHDDDGEPAVITESAWTRLRALAPARSRRAAAAARRPGHLAGGVGDARAPGPRPCRRLDRRRGHRRDVAGLGRRNRRARKTRQASADGQDGQVRDLFWPTEAALVAAVWGGWVTAAVAVGPTARPDRWPTLLYLAGAAGGYWWLRRHEAVQAARQRRDDLAAEIADKKQLWHQILPRIGLDGWHVQWRRTTNLGEERLITTSPENALATRIAASSAAIAEKLAHILGLPYGRIDFTTTEFPGELIIGIRTVDLSVRDAAYHPMTTPWPEAEPSPFADWFGETASIRDRMIWGFSPEDGSPLDLTLFSEIGGRAVGVMGATGSGKSNVLNDAREFITRCTDARMVQLNGAHMGDELTWEPLSALTLCGPVATDEDIRNNIAEALAALCLLVTNRSATLAETGHSTFQPTEDDPAVGIVIDEVDEIVAHVPGAGKALDFLASKQRKSAVFLLLATQRFVIAALGGGMVRANMSEVLVGMVNRATESRHASGAEKEIPDIREYAKRRPRLLPAVGPALGHRHRAGPGVPARQAPRRTRLHQTARHRPPPPAGLEHPRHAATGPRRRPGRRHRGHRHHHAADRRPARQARQHHPDRHPARTSGPGGPGCPGPSRWTSRRPTAQTLLRMLARPDGVTAKEAGEALGKSKSRAGDYLRILDSRGIAVRTGSSRASRYRLAPAARRRITAGTCPGPAGRLRHGRGPRRRGPRRPGRRGRGHAGRAGTGPPDPTAGPPGARISPSSPTRKVTRS